MYDNPFANELDSTEWASVRRHLFKCDFCLRRLIDIDARLAATESTDGAVHFHPAVYGQPDPRSKNSAALSSRAENAVAERFLLREDADRLIAEATASDVLVDKK